MALPGHFNAFMRERRKDARLVVQPRMGFGPVADMRSGLEQVAALDGAVVGTLTLDSYTRVGDYVTPEACLARGMKLNGYPIMTHCVAATRAMLEGLHGPDFPVQMRHGTALPQHVFGRMIEVGLDATEGGPVSYCLPYSRVPLAQAVAAWAEGCRMLAGNGDAVHLESFGGCLLGQLCPPSLLLATSVLECLFFRQHGIRSVSLSYAQGTSRTQDRAALRALRMLAGHYLAGIDWHVVFYIYMGLFPSSFDGATALIRDGATLARETGCERLIVKTAQEARQVPDVMDNIQALRLALDATGMPPSPDAFQGAEEAYCSEIHQEADALIGAVLDLSPDIGRGLVLAFERGMLDVPYCLHADNAGRTSAYIDGEGALRWGETGRMPMPSNLYRLGRPPPDVTSSDLLRMLRYVVDRYDMRTT